MIWPCDLLGGRCVKTFSCDGHRLKGMKRTKSQALGTRATILDAAEAVFFSHGVTQTTLDEIADAAGVTRGAIYGHFRNKDAVFEAVFERFALPLDPFAIPLPADDANPLGRLQIELETRLSRALRDTRMRHLYSIVFARCESTDETALFWRRVRAASRFAEVQIEQALRYAISREQLAADLDAYQAALFIHATLTGVFRKDLLRRRHDARLNLGRIVGMTFQCLTRH
jgi:TetR/AcrR family transcriptional regulator, acrAB operon repressor